MKLELAVILCLIPSPVFASEPVCFGTVSETSIQAEVFEEFETNEIVLVELSDMNGNTSTELALLQTNGQFSADSNAIENLDGNTLEVSVTSTMTGETVGSGIVIIEPSVFTVSQAISLLETARNRLIEAEAILESASQSFQTLELQFFSQEFSSLVEDINGTIRTAMYNDQLVFAPNHVFYRYGKDDLSIEEDHDYLSFFGGERTDTLLDILPDSADLLDGDSIDNESINSTISTVEAALQYIADLVAEIDKKIDELTN